jgi:hypothetical protein
MQKGEMRFPLLAWRCALEVPIVIEEIVGSISTRYISFYSYKRILDNLEIETLYHMLLSS